MTASGESSVTGSPTGSSTDDVPPAASGPLDPPSSFPTLRGFGVARHQPWRIQKNMKTSLLTVATLAALALTACSKSSSEGQPSEQAEQAVEPAASPAPAPVAKNPATEAKKVFKSTCVVCHGETGAGDGPGAAALDPKPRDFGDAEWQSSVTDDHIAKVIRDGGAAVGKSPIMPGNPQLKGKDDVLAELVKIVRDFKK